MAKLLKLRRGTTSQHSSFTGAEGEVTVDTTKVTVVVHDGSTAGGIPLAKESALSTINTDLVNDTTPQLGGNLDVNTKNITFGDSSDGATDDVLTFGVGAGGVPDLSIYSNGTEAILATQDGGTIKIKDGSTTMATFSGASNQLDIGVHTVFIGASSNASWDKANNRFSGTITEINVTANNSTDETVYPLFVDGATGSQGAETDTGLTYNPSTGLLTAVGLTLSGDLTVNGTTTTVATTNTTVTDNLLELNSGAGSNANDCGILIERGSTGDNAIIAWDESADKFVVGTTTGTASSTGNIAITGGTLNAEIVEDGKGDLRIIPQLSKSAQHTIVATDHGKHSINSSGGWVLNTSTGFTAGQAVTLINNSGSDQTITATGVTLYNTADASTGNRTLAGRGMATVICTASNTYYISGAGLS